MKEQTQTSEASWKRVIRVPARHKELNEGDGHHLKWVSSERDEQGS